MFGGDSFFNCYNRFSISFTMVLIFRKNMHTYIDERIHLCYNICVTER